MPKYTSQDQVKSGLPLGGLGAGKMEIFPQGFLDQFTFLNNIHNPLTGQQQGLFRGIPGFHWAVGVSDHKTTVVKLLQTNTVGVEEYPTVSSIDFDGLFPWARLDYRDEAWPLKISLEAFSPFVPQDEKNSSLPAAVFHFKVTNPTAHKLQVSLMGIGRNLCGCWPVGRFNQVLDSSKAVAAYYYNKKAQVQDLSYGEMCLSLLKSPRFETSYLGEWNMQSRPFVFDHGTLTLGQAWQEFSQSGRLSNVNTERVVMSESQQLGAALAATMELKPKESVGVTFVWSWYFPSSAEGHHYENHFRSVAQVNEYMWAHAKELTDRTRAVKSAMAGFKMEEWLEDALWNNLYPLSSSSFWSRKGRFGLFESPVVCPLLGTLDVRFYGSLPLAFLYPGLELTELFQFAHAQRPQGYVPHDLGWRRSDLPSDSTNSLHWKDLNAKFVLLAYRDYLWTQDASFLNRIYPFVKKAHYWLTSTDHNKDFLPDQDGADQTFDLWVMSGAGAYVGGLYLASLLALEKMAVVMKDEATVKEARQLFSGARKNFEKKLWHKEYFMAYNNCKGEFSQHQIPQYVKIRKINPACTASQLVGQWAAHLLDLGYILPQERVRKAVRTILDWNGSASAFGVVNSVFPTKEKDAGNIQAQNIWVGVSYVVAALAIYEGFEQEGLRLAHTVWENIRRHNLSPWNQPDLLSSSDGTYMFGDHYMRNLVVWAIPLALAKRRSCSDQFLKGWQGVGAANVQGMGRSKESRKKGVVV